MLVMSSEKAATGLTAYLISKVHLINTVLYHSLMSRFPLVLSFIARVLSIAFSGVAHLHIVLFFSKFIVILHY